jgi:hypothetical protein
VTDSLRKLAQVAEILLTLDEGKDMFQMPSNVESHQSIGAYRK